MSLVELTSKLVSRSERLRIRSEELIGRNTLDREMYDEYGNLFTVEEEVSAYDYGEEEVSAYDYGEEEVSAYDYDVYGQAMQP